MSKYLISLLFLLTSTASFGASLNFYESFLSLIGLDHHSAVEWGATLSALLSLVILFLIGSRYKASVEKDLENVVPDGRISIRSFVDSVLDFVSNLTGEIIGKRHREFLPLLTGIFVFILISNLCGMIPGLVPTTESINTNLAMGLSVFIYYTWAGIKEHGFGYVKQFIGPVWWLMPLMIVIELVAHLARPVSLSLRLMGNIFGDHLVLAVFNELTLGIIAPALFMFFGLMVACLQSFIFTLLSSIYISLAISHDH